MPIPFLSVLLPTYRQPEVLVQTVRDLNQQTYPEDSWELVVLDDGSFDGSDIIALETITEDIPFTLKRRAVDHGGENEHANLFNELVRLAAPDTDVFVHVEDVRLQEDYLHHHAKWHQSDQYNLVTGPMYEAPRETFDPEECDRWELMEMGGDAEAYRCGFRSIWAKSMSYPQELVARLKELDGGSPFDGEMEDWGYHEIEFAYRASYHADAQCIYDTNCGVYHRPHNPRDELSHRGIQREEEKEQGEEQNTEYICDKHGIDALPSWQIGEQITDLPPLINPS